MSMDEKRKRYKLWLTPQFSKDKVSRNTYATWKQKSEIALQRTVVTNQECAGSMSDVPSSSYLENTVDVNIAEHTHNVVTHAPCDTDINCTEEEEISICDTSSDIDQHSDYDEAFDYDEVEDDYCYDSDQRPSFSKTMFEASHLTVNDVVSMVAAFALRHKCSNQARKDLIRMLQLCAGPKFHNMNISNYQFEKLFDPPDSTIKYNYFCTICLKKIYVTTKSCFKSERRVCESCKETFYINHNSSNMFVTIDIKYQLELLLKNSKVTDTLIAHFKTQRNVHGSKVNDIQSGSLYKKIDQVSNYIITFNFNTDGAPLFHKSKRGFWPIQFVINELPPTMRFKHVLMAGVMVVEKEPSAQLINLYLKDFIDQVMLLYSQGISFHDPLDNTEFQCRPLILCCSVDSVARPLIQNRLQFNGYYGCSFCYQQGEHITAMRYPFEDKEAPLRSHESHLQDVETFKKSNSLIQSRGVKGSSEFCNLAYFDMVWSFPVDVMHTIILGVTKHVWEIFDSRRPRFVYTAKIDKKLLQIQPPHDIHKLPIAITNVSNWKAKDWKCWLLYYSIPILLECLPAEYMQHYALLVKCAYTLLQTSISPEELHECELNLLKFVAIFECLHGRNVMRFNVHSLLHVVQSVRQSGPLWATSAFPYESNIYYLKLLVNGPKGVEQQMAKKSLRILAYKADTWSNSAKNGTKLFSEQLFDRVHYECNSLIENGVLYANKGISSKDFNDSKRVYNRCVYNKVIFATKNYCQSKRFNDSFVQLKCGQIAQIIEICALSDLKCMVLLNNIYVEKVVIHDIEIPHLWKIKHIDARNSFCVPIEDVSKMVFVSFDEQSYICNIPNSIEDD